MEHTALIYVMVLMSAADSDMTDRELFTMGEIVRIVRELGREVASPEEAREMLHMPASPQPRPAA